MKYWLSVLCYLKNYFTSTYIYYFEQGILLYIAPRHPGVNRVPGRYERYLGSLKKATSSNVSQGVENVHYNVKNTRDKKIKKDKHSRGMSVSGVRLGA